VIARVLTLAAVLTAPTTTVTTTEEFRAR